MRRKKPATSLKRGKIRPRLLQMTNRKSHMHFWLVPKSMTLDDLERPLRTPFFKMHAFSDPTTKIWIKMLSARKMQPITLVSGKRQWETQKLHIARFCLLFARFFCLEWNSLLAIYSSWIWGEKPGRLLKVIRFSHKIMFERTRSLSNASYSS